LETFVSGTQGDSKIQSIRKYFQKVFHWNDIGGSSLIPALSESVLIFHYPVRHRNQKKING